ncbi:MAG: sulfotransferase [Anaerolineae bacterium]|nr:sulfotransferase [Anaerolineae bacterium]
MSYFRRKGLTRVDQQFLAGGSFRNWMRLVAANGGVDWRYWIRSLYVSVVALLGAPFRAYENARFGARIAATPIREVPIFILGHWRSGTTHVMRLIARDPAFAVVTFIHTMIPGLYLSSPLFRAILASSLPKVRPMDNVSVSPDAAEEEEYALGNLSPYSFYHALSFPKKMREIFDKYVLFEGVERKVIEQWKAIYLHFLKKVTFSSNGKRLLLKNPANTGRIPTLLELFPDAKFIHVYRNPYIVYSSTMHWLDKELAPTALQDVDEEMVRENALRNYEKLMLHYEEDKALIPEGNLVEVRFEDFEANPLGEVAHIYQALGLVLLPEAQQQMQQYLLTVKGYKKNSYRLDHRTRRELARRWGFMIRRWGYEPPNA